MGADAAPEERRVLETMSDMENKDTAQAAASTPESEQAQPAKTDKNKAAKKAKDKKPGFFERIVGLVIGVFDVLVKAVVDALLKLF